MILPGDDCWLMIDCPTFKGHVVACGTKVVADLVIYCGELLRDQDWNPTGHIAKENMAICKLPQPHSNKDGIQVPLRFLRRAVVPDDNKEVTHDATGAATRF